MALEDPACFANGRVVGAYVGSVLGKDQSGDCDPQRREEAPGNRPKADEGDRREG